MHHACMFLIFQSFTPAFSSSNFPLLATTSPSTIWNHSCVFVLAPGNEDRFFYPLVPSPFMSILSWARTRQGLQLGPRLNERSSQARTISSTFMAIPENLCSESQPDEGTGEPPIVPYFVLQPKCSFPYA